MRKIIIFAFLFSLLCSVSAFLSFATVHKQDRAEYHKLVDYTLTLRGKRTLEKKPARQFRREIQKDFWMLHKGERVHLQLKGQKSDLVLRQSKKKFEMEEVIQQLECSLHERSASYQIVAPRASYDGEILLFEENVSISHPNGRATAEKVSWLHPSLKKSEQGILVLDGNVHIETKDHWTLTGNKGIYLQDAIQLFGSCRLSKNEDSIEADSMLYEIEKEKLTCIQPSGKISPAQIAFRAQELLWLKDQNRLLFKKNVQIDHSTNTFSLQRAEAEHGSLTYIGNFQPCILELSGNVHLTSAPNSEAKKGYATADTLLYDSDNELIILSAESPKRTLFWRDDLRLSAPEIHIHREPNGAEMVQGIGDVHFAFDFEEETKLHEIFGKLL